MGYIYVGITLVLTIYGQLILKREVLTAGAFPHDWPARLQFVFDLLRNPWVISAFAAAGLAAIAYMIALSYLDLSRAYVFMSLSFVSVALISSVIFGEALTTISLLGLLLIVIGVGLGSQG